MNGNVKRGRESFKKFKGIMNFLCGCYSLLPFKWRKKKFEKLRYKRGVWGIGMRYVLLKTLAEKCGENVSIHEGCFILHPERISIGNNVSIHPMTYIDAAGKIEIGNDVSIAHGVTVLSSTHNYSDVTVPIKDQGMSLVPTYIGDNVWIGAKATVLCGNRVSSGSIIAAGAVVTHNVSENAIVAGAPAKVIKERV